MRAITFDSLGKIVVSEREQPAIEPEEVCIKVAATAINRADILQKKGLYPPPKGVTEIPGLEVSGTISKIGKRVSQWKEGDHVMALLAGGGYADYVAVHQSLLIPKPNRMTMVEAAAIPEAFLTAYQALHFISNNITKDNILIHAGASGVGSAAIQLARLTFQTIIATCSATKIGLCKSLGADMVIDYRSESFDEKMVENKLYADCIIDFIGGPYLQKNIRVARQDGCIVLLGLLGGVKPVEVSLKEVLFKRLSILGSTLRTRSLFYKAKLIAAFEQDILPLFEQGAIKPIIDSTFSFEEVHLAHSRMEQNLNSGKIVLTF